MHLIMDSTTKGIRTSVLEHLDKLAAYTGADIFLLSPKSMDSDSSVISSYGCENSLDNRFRVAIYGDIESAEHAKTRLLIMIDQIVYQCPFLKKSSSFLSTLHFHSSLSQPDLGPGNITVIR